MRIQIDTHDITGDALQPLLDFLQTNKWDYRFVNKDEPVYGMSDSQVEECKHNFVNGACIKCFWLEI